MFYFGRQPKYIKQLQNVISAIGNKQGTLDNVVWDCLSKVVSRDEEPAR